MMNGHDAEINRVLATATNKLAAIEGLAIKHPDAGDALHKAAEYHGLFEKYGRGDVEHVIGMGLKGQRSLARPQRLAQLNSGSCLDMVCAADIAPKSIEWLWQYWIAVGKVTVLAGEGGEGKSTILCDIAARTTTGSTWPDAAPGCAPGFVIILAAEDGADDTIVPRLIAAGADRRRVFLIRSVTEDKRRRIFNLQADLAKLEDTIAQLRAERGDVPVLVIIDPISSYLGPKVDSHKNAEVRAVLEPLGDLAERHRVAIIANNHFSKAGGSANNRMIGSVAFVNYARAGFIVTPDAQDESRKLLLPSKMNIGPLRKGLAYRIGGRTIEHEGKEIMTSEILWESAPVEITANAALAAVAGGSEGRTQKAEATEFLTAFLSNGPVAVAEVNTEARAAGINPKALRSAREALGIRPTKTGMNGGWVWELPKMPNPSEGAQDAHV